MLCRIFLCAAAILVAACYNPDAADFQSSPSHPAESSIETAAAESAFECLIGDETSFQTLLKNHRAVLVGELHGTAEMPSAFGEMVEQAAADGRRVAVALEFDRRWQTDIDAVMRAQDQTAAEAAFAARATMDGRTSAAMRKLLLRLREIKQQGADLHVFAIDFWQRDEEPKPYAAPDWLPEEVDVAKGLRDIRQGEKAVADCLSIDCDILMFFAGNFHTRTKISESFTFNAETGEERPFTAAPAGSIIAHDMPTISVDLVHSGGTFKANTGDGLKINEWGPNVPDYATHERAFVCASPSYHHELVYNVGKITASSDPTQPNP